ncbi:MAG TPA: RNA polymerase sigma factor [candidate division Zixibacteria bacterium]|nr:RNA polymerase sigma factor [candidate division Zixibacteria bacterium]
MSKTVPELVERFVQGDETAFAELVNRFQKRIYSLAYQMMGNHLDADEVTQETFVRVYRKRKDLTNVNYFSTFLTRVATNYAIDLIRKRRGHSDITEDATSLPGGVQMDLSRQNPTPREVFENKRLMEEINRALDQLPPRQRLTAIMHDIEGYSKADIAAVFGCPQATVRSNLHIARNKLKKILRQRLKLKEQK